MILADCLSGHFGGLHYAQQAKPTGSRIPRRLIDTGNVARGPDIRHARISTRLCCLAGCTQRADPYSETCVAHDGGLP